MTNKLTFVFLFYLVPLVCILGCGYTTLRDIDEEEKQAELSAIDSLLSAPDLTISGIEYSYIPPPPRRNALDRGGENPRVHFLVIISNTGTADFPNPFILMYEHENREYRGISSYSFRELNKARDTIRSGDRHVFEIEDDYPYYGSPYRFTMVTNAIIQRTLLETLQSGFNSRITVVQSRELNYDNNDCLITVASRRQN